MNPADFRDCVSIIQGPAAQTPVTTEGCVDPVRPTAATLLSGICAGARLASMESTANTVRNFVIFRDIYFKIFQLWENLFVYISIFDHIIYTQHN